VSEYADELESSKQGPEFCDVCHEQAEFCTCPVEDDVPAEATRRFNATVKMADDLRNSLIALAEVEFARAMRK
jgi:hypothetical protein